MKLKNVCVSHISVIMQVCLLYVLQQISKTSLFVNGDQMYWLHINIVVIVFNHWVREASHYILTPKYQHSLLCNLKTSLGFSKTVQHFYLFCFCFVFFSIWWLSFCLYVDTVMFVFTCICICNVLSKSMHLFIQTSWACCRFENWRQLKPQWCRLLSEPSLRLGLHYGFQDIKGQPFVCMIIM